MHGDKQEKERHKNVRRCSQRTNSIAFRKLQQFMDRKKRDRSSENCQDRNRCAQHDRKNDRNQNDCGEYSFDEFQISPAGRARLAPELIALE